MTRFVQTRLLPPRVLKPLQQGALDSLCGVYSIVNALRLLCSELSQEKAEDLFGDLMNSLNRRGRHTQRAAWCGLSSQRLLRLLDRAVLHMRYRYGIEITVERVPPDQRRHKSLRKLWAVLSRRIGDGAVSLVGLSGIYDHWTVAFAISTKHIKLFDSDGMRVLRRSRCTTRTTSNRYGMSLHHIFFIHRASRSLRQEKYL